MNQPPSDQPPTYTAANIRILSGPELVDRFDWAKAGQLAEKYSLPLDHVERGLQACRESGVDPEYFVRRYLDKDKTVERRPEVEDAFLELVRQEREKASRGRAGATGGTSGAHARG
jgi:hypothetical protein